MLRTIVSAERACPLPAAVEWELTQLEGRHGQRADWQAQHRLAGLDEAAAVRVLQKIGESQQPVQNLSAYIQYMATNYDASQDAACGSVPSKRGANKALSCTVISRCGSCFSCKNRSPVLEGDFQSFLRGRRFSKFLVNLAQIKQNYLISPSFKKKVSVGRSIRN
jgi:hypothetical protein